MSDHPTDFQGDVRAAIKDAICAKMPGARVEVTGGGGHYSIGVTSPAFSGMSMLGSFLTQWWMARFRRVRKGDN